MFCAGMLALNESFVNLWVGPSLYVGLAANFWITIAGAASILAALSINTLFALGRLKATSIAIFGHAIAYGPILAIAGYALGLPGVAAAVSLAMLPSLAWYLPVAMWRALGWGRIEIFDFRREACFAFGASAIAWLVATNIPVAGWGDFALAVLCSSISYGVVVLVFSQRAREEIRNSIHLSMRLVRY
jgi:hypothetical protein